MPDPTLDIKLEEEDIKPNKQYANQGFDYYSQGSNVEGTDSQYIESPSIFLTNEDVSDIKGRNQGYVDTTANALGTFGLKTVGTLVQDVGYLAGTINGLSKVIDPSYDTKVADFTDNPLIEFGDEMNKWVDKIMPNYESTDETENPTALRNILGSVGNSAFRDGGPFMAAAYIMGAGLGKIVSTPTKLARMTKIAKAGGELAAEATKFSKFIQKAPQEVVQLMVNNGEAMLEADHNSEEVYQDVYAKEMAKHGDEDTAKQIADAAKTETFKSIYVLNMGILKINNLETRSLFKPSLYSRRPLKELTKEWSSLVTKTDKAKFIAQKGWNYLSDPIKESAEELLQGGAGQSVKERVNKDGADTKISTEDLFNDGINTLINGVKRAGTPEGVLEMITSTILSGPISTYHKYKASQDERTNHLKRKGIYDSSIKSDYQNIEGLTEEVKDGSTGSFKSTLSNKGKELLSSARTYNDFENLKNVALVTDDQTLYGIVRDTQLANLSFGHFEMGLGENLESKISELSKEIGHDLKASGKTTIEDFGSGKNISIEQYTASIKEKIKKYEDVYNTLENRYTIPNSEVRQAAFINGVLQTELKNKISNAKPSVGETWLNHITNTKDVDIDKLNKEIESLDDKLGTNVFSRKIEINNLIQDHNNLKLFEATATNLEIEDNIKNYKDNKANKLYYKALKEQFDLLTNPETGKNYIDSKVQEDEEKNKSTNDTSSNTTGDTLTNKNSTTIDTSNDSSNISDNQKSDNQSINLSSEILEQNTELENSGIDEVEDSTEKPLPKELENVNDAEIEYSENKVNKAFLDLNGFNEEEYEPVDTNNDYTPEEKEDTNEVIKDKVEEAAKNIKKEKERNDAIPLFITNRFEVVVDGSIPVDISTGETKLENEEGLKKLLELKKGDKVEAKIGWYYPNKSKPDGDFLSYKESLTKKGGVFGIRIYKDGVKLGVIKPSTEEFNKIIDNIKSKPNLQNKIIETNLEINYKWGGFVRNLINKEKIEVYYTTIPFDDRLYKNSPSEVVGKDFLIVTKNLQGNLLLSKHNKAAITNLGLKDQSEVHSSFDNSNLLPGVMYTLIKAPDGKIIPLQTKGEYITKENKDYVLSEITKAIKIKRYDLKVLKKNISPFIYYDKTKGIYIEKGNILYKDKNIGLKGLKEMFEKQDIYKPIDIKEASIKSLDNLLKLNVPKQGKVQFIQPKVTLDLSPLEDFNIQESKEFESNTINDENPITLPKDILEQQENSSIFENEESNKVSEDKIDKPIPERRRNFKSDFTINSNKTLDKYTKELVIKSLLKKYGKKVDLLSTVDPNNELNTEELLEQRISCM